MGIIFLGVGIIGIVLPVLPTTPFVLLASFCLTKGSDKINNRFKKLKCTENTY
ncbi:MAG: YbaN family protein [Fusobacteriales bacterium]|nr:YbaN family protein [Fusobacteriales bacterium]